MRQRLFRPPLCPYVTSHCAPTSRPSMLLQHVPVCSYVPSRHDPTPRASMPTGGTRGGKAGLTA
eukprot:3109323-Rhodomonas_salina.1